MCLKRRRASMGQRFALREDVIQTPLLMFCLCFFLFLWREKNQ